MADPQRNLTFRGTHTVKMVTERVLRSIFAADTMDKRYKYSNVEKQTKVKIYRGYPKRLEMYPTITISVGGFPVKMQAFDGTHEIMSEHMDGEGLPIEVAGGMVTMPVKLKVFCKGSSDDRENLTDILVMILRIFNRADFQKFGWVNMAVEGEGQFVDIDKEIVFTNAVTFEAQTDYIFQMLPQETDVFIEKIVTNVIPVLNFDPEPLPPPPPGNAPSITGVPGQIYEGVPAIIQGINFLGTEVFIGDKLVPCTVDSGTQITFIPPSLSTTGLVLGEPFYINVNFSGYGLVAAPTATQYELPPEPGQLWYATNGDTLAAGTLDGQDGWVKGAGGPGEDYIAQSTYTIGRSKALLTSAVYPGGDGYAECYRDVPQKANNYQVSFKLQVLDYAHWYADTIELEEYIPAKSNVAARMGVVKAGYFGSNPDGVAFSGGGGYVFACPVTDVTAPHAYTLIVDINGKPTIKVDGVISWTGSNGDVVNPADRLFIWSEVYDTSAPTLSVWDDISLRYNIA